MGSAHSPSWDNTLHVQFRLARKPMEALQAEAAGWGVSTNLAAKLILTQRLDPETYNSQLAMLDENYRMDDPERPHRQAS